MQKCTDNLTLINEVTDWIKSGNIKVVNIDPDFDLIESRYVDSMRFMDLIFFLSEICNKDLATLISIEDMRTLTSITEFINKHRITK